MAFIYILFHLMVYPYFYSDFCNYKDFRSYEEMFKASFLGPEQECIVHLDGNMYLDLNWNIFVYFMTFPLPYLCFLLAMKNLNKYISNKVMIYISSPSKYLINDISFIYLQALKWILRVTLCMSVVLLKNYLFHKLGTGMEFKLQERIFHFEKIFYCFVLYSLINLPIIGLTLALEWMISAVIRNWKSLLWFFMVGLLSTRIYDLVLLDVCHFHHTFLSNH